MNPINPIKLQTSSGTLSNYAQRYVKSQIKSTSFALERFFKESDSKFASHEQELKELGFKRIGKDTKEGVVISDELYDYRVFSADDGYLGFDILKPDSDKIYRHFSVNDKSEQYRQAGYFPNMNIEDEMNRVLDYVNDKLFDARRVCMTERVPQPFIPGETTSEKIAEANKALQSAVQNPNIKTPGFIGKKEEDVIKSINDKLRITQELYKKIPDCRTKWEVKKSYPNYLPQPVANKFGFKNIGPNGESVSFFRTSYRNDAYDAIIVTDKSGYKSKFVISKDNKTVQKTQPSKYVKSENSGYRLLITPNYYTQKEIDESNLYPYLDCLNKEMDKFIEHTQGWFDKKAERKLIRSNSDNATLEPYKELLNDIHSNFEEYREKMRKYMRKPHKNKKFKTENGISTQLSSTAVKFDNITPDGYDLRLSYPKVHDKTATQLLVMRDDKVENSFYIINDKLLRFKIKDTHDKITHYNQNMYYYDKKYLEDSNLNDYLLLLQDKLHELNQKLDSIRKKQIKNKARYHIKTKEELAQQSEL